MDNQKKVIKKTYKSLQTQNDSLCDVFQNPQKTTYHYTGNGVFSPYNPPSQGGIYVMYDSVEKRIVRIGKAEKSLLKRLKEHFVKEDKDHSILRKHVGRCLLSGQNQLASWNTKGLHNPVVEKQVTQYLMERMVIYVIPLADKKQIKDLEKSLIIGISTYNMLRKQITGSCVQSNNWLGNRSNNNRVKESGLWNHQHVIF